MIKAFPKIKGEKIIIAALIMVLVAEILKTIWPLGAIDSESADAIQKFIAQKNSPKNIIIDSMELFSKSILAMSLISTGIRVVRDKWSNIKGIAMTILGIGLCSYHLVSILSYMNIGKGLDDVHRPNFEAIKLKVERQTSSPKIRSTYSKMYAQDKYRHEGKIVEYVSEAGESKAYEPTADDIKSRNLENNAREIWDYTNKRLPRIFNWWIAVSVLSLLLGVFTPIKTRTQPDA